jgi:hypothetical protein
MITAYNTKTKERNVPIQDCVVSLNDKKTSCLAKGHDGKGNKLMTFLSIANAEAAVAAGHAAWGEHVKKAEEPKKPKKQNSVSVMRDGKKELHVAPGVTGERLTGKKPESPMRRAASSGKMVDKRKGYSYNRYRVIDTGRVVHKKITADAEL